MPYKFNQPRRHKIPTTKYRVTNWPDYDAALVRRGALTVWFTDGRALQVLAYVARAARTPQPARGPLIDVTPVQADGKLLHTAYDEPVS